MFRPLDVLIAVAVLALLVGGAWWLFLSRLDRSETEAGGSLGRQFLGGRERAYGATISLPGRPAAQVTVRYYSRGEAKRALKSMYGKRNVSDIHALDGAGPTSPSL